MKVSHRDLTAPPDSAPKNGAVPKHAKPGTTYLIRITVTRESPSK